MYYLNEFTYSVQERLHAYRSGITSSLYMASQTQNAYEQSFLE
jgi:hypothetical protein